MLQWAAPEEPPRAQSLGLEARFVEWIRACPSFGRRDYNGGKVGPRVLALLEDSGSTEIVDPYSGDVEAEELKQMFRDLMLQALGLMDSLGEPERMGLVEGALVQMGECLMTKVRVAQQLVMQLSHVRGTLEQVVHSLVEDCKQQAVARYAMAVHNVFGDYMEHADLTWGWEHTAVWYMHQLHLRGLVSFPRAPGLIAHDYRAPAYGGHPASQMFPCEALEQQLASQLTASTVGGLLQERVNQEAHPEFGEMQRLLNQWLGSAEHGLDAHGLLSEDQSKLELSSESCEAVLTVIYQTAPKAAAPQMPAFNPTQ